MFIVKQCCFCFVNFIDIGVVFCWIVYWYDDVYCIVKLLMDCFQCGNMFIVVIFGVVDQNSQGIIVWSVIGQGIQCWIYMGWEVEQFVWDVWMVVSELVEIVVGGENVFYLFLCYMVQWIEQVKFQVGRIFIQICFLDMLVKL